MNQMLKRKWLLLKINQKRSEMIALGETHGLGARETLACSQEIDRLLNEYDKASLDRSEAEMEYYSRHLLKRPAS